MASVQERFNRILNRIEENQARTQDIQERFNNIVNRVNLKQETFNKRRPIAVEKIANTDNQQTINNSQSQQQTQRQSGQVLPNLSEDYIQSLPASQQATARRIQEQTQKLNSMSASDRQKALDNLQSNQNKSTIIPSANVEKIEGKTLTKSDLEKIKNIDNKTYYKAFGEKGFAGVNSLINNIKKFPEILLPLAKDAGYTGENLGLGGVKGGIDLVSYINKVDNKVKQIEEDIGLPENMIYAKDRNAYRQTMQYQNTYNALQNGEDINLKSLVSDEDNDIDLEDWSKQKSEELEESMTGIKNNINTKIQKNIDSTSNEVTRKFAELAPSIGNNMVGMGVSAIDPLYGTAYFIGSASGSYYDDGIQRGMNEDEALMYGTIAGFFEGVTEKFAVKEATKAGWLLGKGDVKRALISTGLSMGENFLQESIMEPIQETVAYITGGKNATRGVDFSDLHLPQNLTKEGLKKWYNESPKTISTIKNMTQRMLESGLDGALSSIILEGSSAGISSAVNVKNKIMQGQKVSQHEIQQAFKDIQESGKVDIEAKFKESIQSQVQKASREWAEKNNIPNLQQNNTINQNTNQQQQIIQEQNKKASNQNVVANEKQNSLKEKSFEDIVDEAMSNYEYDEVKSPLQNRDIETIGKEKVNAYQYDNPEVKPFFQEMAKMLGEDVGNIASENNRKTIKGGGTSLNTNISAIKQLREMGYSYNQIIDGIANIIDDHGKENNAVSKKLEIIIDDQLRNGYINSYGKYISPNEEYINLINKDNANVANDFTSQQQTSQIDNKNNLNQNVEGKNKLEQRISGDELLNTQDFIEDIKNVGADVDENGYVTVYHRTSKENADNIYKNGKMSAKEDGIFFSTSKDGYNNSNYGDSVVELKVPAEMLELDDIFDDEASVKIKLNNKNQQLDINDYLVKNNTKNMILQNDENIKKAYETLKNAKNDVNKNSYSYNLPQKVENKSNRVYNKITAKERNQIEGEVRTWRINEEDGIHYIDLSKNGYHSYIYEKNGNSIIPIKKIIASEDFKNYIRKGVENGTFTNAEGFTKSIAEIKSEYRRYRDSNDSMSKGRPNNRNDKLSVGQVRGNEANNTTRNIKQNSQNGGLEKSSSFNLPKENAKIENVISEDLPLSNEAREEKIAKILTQPVEKVKEKDRTWAIVKANIIDKGLVFEELERKANKMEVKAGNKKNRNRRELQAKWDFTLLSQARGQNAIGEARYEYDSKTKTRKQISKSLEDIKTEVGDNREDFYNYMYHQLNIDRMTLEEIAQKRIDEIKNKYMVSYSDEVLQNMAEEELQEWAKKRTKYKGKEIYGKEDTNMILELRELKQLATKKNKPVFGESVTAEMSKKIVDEYEQKYPEFKQYAQDVYDYLDANKAELVKNGVISQELSDKFKEMYPHYVPIKRVDKGGNAVNVPLETNRTGINSPIARAKGGNSDIQPLFETMAERTLQTYRASARNSFGVELKNTLDRMNKLQQDVSNDVNLDEIVETMSEQEQSGELLQEGKNGKNPTFTVFENGKKVTFDVSKDMYDALKPLSDSSLLSKTIKPLNKISNLRRAVLTEYNPVFLATNAVKDAQDVLGNSQHATRTYLTFPEAYAQIIRKGYWYQEYVNNGGEANSYFRDGKFESDKETSKPKSIGKKIVKFPFNAISTVNNVIEMAPRLAEYIASRKMGASIQTSMLDASRVTTNFKAGGDLTKALNRNGATFLNASVQGMQQQIRNIQNANANGVKGWTVLACKWALMGLPTAMLGHLLWKDDEDYEELQDYVKDNYYCIYKYGDGKFIRIPKGRLSATVGKIVSNVDKYITEDKEINADNLVKDFWEDILFAGDNLAPNNPVKENIISPLVQSYKNESWYGEDIVPKRLQDKPAKEQYDETIDSFSIWLGDKLNMSPYKINYVLDQYSGGAGDVILPTMTKQAENNVVEDKFTTDSVMKSRYPGEFYDKIDELKVNSNSSNASDEDILKYKYASEVSKEMSELYKEKRDIQNSDDSDKEKKEQLKEVQKDINKLARNGLENIDNLEVNNATAKIGDKEYYKYNGEWTKIDNDKNKIEGISAELYVEYKNRLSEITDGKSSTKFVNQIGINKSRKKC